MTAGPPAGAPARPRAARPGLGLTVLAVTAALAFVVGRAPVLVHQCVAGDGLVGTLGLRLALLRPDASCPSGTLALGPDGAQAAGIVVMVAAPVLLLHLVLAGTGAGLLAVAAALVRALGRLLARAGLTLPEAVTLPAVGRSPRPRTDRAPVLVALHLPTVGLRGPPVSAR